MKIKDWFKNKDYQTGLILYSTLPKHNRNLLRNLQRKENSINRQKLFLELKKNVDFDLELPGQTPGQSNVQNLSAEIKQRHFRPLRMHELPIELHDQFIQQKTDFYTAASLHQKLTALRPDQETKALDLCIKIENLFDSIQTAWQVFDHYIEFKTVPEIEVKKYHDFTPGQLIKAENSKRGSITRAKQKVKEYQEKILQAKTKELINKFTTALEKKKEALLVHKAELETIKQLINNYGQEK